MLNVENLTRRFETVFDRRQSSVLAETITEAYSELVKTSVLMNSRRLLET